jgi:hypothetical protein
MALVRPNNGVKVEVVEGSPVLEAEGVYAQLKKDEEAAGGKKEPVTIERASKPCFIIKISPSPTHWTDEDSLASLQNGLRPSKGSTSLRRPRSGISV